MSTSGVVCGVVSLALLLGGCGDGGAGTKPGSSAASQDSPTGAAGSGGSGGVGGSGAAASGGSGNDVVGSGVEGAGAAYQGTGNGDQGGGGASSGKCAGKSGVVGPSAIEISMDGDLRDAQVYVPVQYDASVPVPLVLAFHGLASSADEQAAISGMNDAAEERGFVVAYPSGVFSSWNGGACCGNAVELGIDDVGFAAAVIDRLSKDYCIDERRVFATGLSSGAFLVHRLGCELSGRVAAIAPVAGVLGIPLGDCQPGRKVPVQHFHGTDDFIAPYDGGGLFDFASVDETVGRWRQLAGCSDAEQVVFDSGDSQCVSAQGCGDGAEVILCTVVGGGHTWPGGAPIPGFGATTMDLDATKAMLDFFEKHPMP